MVVIGAGVGGLVAALELAARGIEVVVLERALAPGGKMREVAVGGVPIDAGPTVLTMRWVLEEVFATAGATLADHLTLHPAEILARHAWSERERLDLFADKDRAADAIGEFAGAAEADGYRRFCKRARAIYRTLERPFILASRPSLSGLVGGVGLRQLKELWQIQPFETLWGALGDYFRDRRLRQLFARYATYCGASPFAAPATLMLVAHVEQEGVWLVEGGMQRIVDALAHLGASQGVALRCAAEAGEILIEGGRATGVKLVTGERIEADAVIVNADIAALADGRLGRPAARAVPRVAPSTRSLSALTWACLAETDGFPLLRHTVFFSNDYAAEFDAIFKQARLPTEPTVYVCAQDRNDRDGCGPPGAERLFCLVNAPPTGDSRPLAAAEIAQCKERVLSLMERCGLRVQWSHAPVVTTPADFERLFPTTGGALYGRAPHGWKASFDRPGARSPTAGLYLAGGSVHPGPGVPMAALSGRMAATSVLADRASIGPSRATAMRGGMSTR